MVKFFFAKIDCGEKSKKNLLSLVKLENRSDFTLSLWKQYGPETHAQLLSTSNSRKQKFPRVLNFLKKKS